jgi:hypothetical protein
MLTIILLCIIKASCKGGHFKWRALFLDKKPEGKIREENGILVV